MTSSGLLIFIWFAIWFAYRRYNLSWDVCREGCKSGAMTSFILVWLFESPNLTEVAFYIILSFLGYWLFLMCIYSLKWNCSRSKLHSKKWCQIVFLQNKRKTIFDYHNIGLEPNTAFGIVPLPAVLNMQNHTVVWTSQRTNSGSNMHIHAVGPHYVFPSLNPSAVNSLFSHKALCLFL